MGVIPIVPAMERCPGSLSFAGIFCRSLRQPCRVCDLTVDVIQHPDGGAGPYLAVHDREVRPCT